METWKIYKHTNKTNGKCYIGQTCRKNLNERWNNGKGYNGTIFAKAIEKYGWDNFDHEIIEDNILTQEEANEREQYWIEYYGSYGENGYNMTRGGDDRSDKGRSVYQIEMGTLQIIAEYRSTLAASRETGIVSIYQCCNRDADNPATRSCISAGGYYWCFVEDWSNDWKPKNHFDHGICQIDKDGNLVKIWKSMSEAALEIKRNPSSIHHAIKNKCKCAGYYWCQKDEFADFKIIKKLRKTCRKIMCVETGKIYESIKFAEIEIGVQLRRCLTGKANKAGGYHWKYVEEENNV